MKKITWGLHKVLFPILTDGDNFAQLFYDPIIAEKVLKAYFAERNELGEVTKEANINSLSVEEIDKALTFIGDYFTDFFFRNQQRNQELNKKMRETALK